MARLPEADGEEPEYRPFKIYHLVGKIGEQTAQMASGKR
jgi:hypothetical protein